MNQVKTQSCRVGVAALVVIGALSISACSAPVTEQPPPATGVTVFEGARLIAGDGGAPIENAAFIVEDTHFVQVGKSGELKVPAGAARVDLTGKTVMPAIIDTHTHLASTRDVLVDQLQGKAYYGVAVAMSLGQDTGDVPFQVREEIIPNAARFRTAGRGITMPEPGRTEAPYWITSEAEGRKAVQELAARKVDLVKIWVDDRDGKYKKLTPPLYSAIIDEAHKHGLRVTAHVFTLEDAKGLLRAGIDQLRGGRDECPSVGVELVRVVGPLIRAWATASPRPWTTPSTSAWNACTTTGRAREMPGIKAPRSCCNPFATLLRAGHGACARRKG